MLRRRGPALALLVGWIALLVTAARWGVAAGSHPPDVTSPEAVVELVRWSGRWLAAMLATWLLALTAWDLVASRRGGLLRGPQVVRALVRLALPSGLAVVLAAPASPAAATSGRAVDRPPPTLVLLDDAPPEPPLPLGAPVTTPPGFTGGPDTPSTEPTLQWRIEAGDHLWAVAERTLTWATGRAPTTAETGAYLQRLVAANRQLLVVPDEPDLVFPGQVVVLPPLA